MGVLTAITAAAVLTAAPGGAGAPAAAMTSDVRCVLAMSVAASNEQARAVALTGVYYFAGRISARQPSFDFATGLKAEAEKMGRADFRGEIQRCAAVLQTNARTLQAALAGLKDYQPRD